MLDVDTADRAGDAGAGDGLLLRAVVRGELGARLGIRTALVRTGYGAIADEWIGIRPQVDHLVTFARA